MMGLRRLDANAFADCTSLKKIDFDAFRGCSNLREVLLKNERIQRIDNRAFNDCTKLERFRFPSVSTRLKYMIDAGHIEIENKIDTTISDSLLERRGSISGKG